MNRILLFVACLCLAPVTRAQSLERAKLDLLFDRLAQHNLAMGSVAISSHGKVLYQASFGHDQTTQTEYRIGSISKVFTAVMVYQLVEEHRLSLADTLDKYFPQLPNAQQVTIAQLLGHRSGLPDFTKNTGFDQWKDQPKTRAELLALIQQQKPDFAPGARADYNNSNYLLLGYVVEQVTGQAYPEALAERILRKAGLAHTYYGAKLGFQPGEAISCKYANGAWIPDRAACLNNFGGAGAIISTPTDLLVFIEALFAGKLISPASLAKMTAMHDGYGSGLFPYGDELHAGFGHNGKTEGFGASLQYYPDSHLAIAYCTNGEVYPKAQILDDVFKICFRLPCVVPTFTPVTLTEGALRKFTGNYASADGHIQLTNTMAGEQLTIAVKGQPFPVVALSEREFWNIPFGFFFEFSVDGARLVLRDGDDTYTLNRK